MRLISKTTTSDDEEINLYEPDEGALEVFVEGIQGVTISGAIVKFNWFKNDSLMLQAGDEESPPDRQATPHPTLFLLRLLSHEDHLSTDIAARRL